MGVIFDILGSFIIRAAIISIVLNLMFTLHETLYSNTERIYLNEVMKAPAETMSYDLKLAGYNASKAIWEARESEIIFYADLDNNGTQETVRYYVSNGILYRTLNGVSPLELARNVTSFTLKYFNVYGVLLSYSNNRTDVKSIQVELIIQSTKTMTSVITENTHAATPHSVKWEIQIFPLNL
ncbi:MAG: hypothetical protein ACYC09_07595 [Bacteroidota bacterium]